MPHPVHAWFEGELERTSGASPELPGAGQRQSRRTGDMLKRRSATSEGAS